MQYYIKHYFNWFLKNFFLITTGTLIGTAIFTTLFLGVNYELPVKLLWEIIFVGMVFTLLNFLFISKNELSKKQMFIRYVIHFFTLLFLGVLLAIYFEWISFSKYSSVLFFIFLVTIIYVLVTIITHFREKKIANDLNKSLKDFQEKA